MAGHTANHSLNVFVRKPAPIQASYIFGAGQTTGLPEVDYLISDLLTIPPEHDNYVVEKVCRLPFAGLPYQPAHDYLEPQETSIRTKWIYYIRSHVKATSNKS